MDFEPDPDRDPSEIVTLQKARRDFLAHKQNTQKESTARAYKYPTDSFVQFCEKHGVEVTGDIDGYLVEQWKQQRHNEVKPVTVHNNVKHLRVFIKWMEGADLVEYGTYDKIEVPAVPGNGTVSEEVLRADEAESVLDYLNTYHYASLYHVLFQTMWETACRIGGAVALDLDDFEPRPHGDNVLRFRNREAAGTPLKNGNKGERAVTVRDSLAKTLSDYIAQRREGETDEYGRDPLFTVPGGRLYRQRAYKNVVALSRPCVHSRTCPHSRMIDDCDAAQDKEQSPSCPSSVSLHPVRRGSITHHINEGWPKEKLSERVDVSVDVLDKHYDVRTEEQARKNRRQYLES